MQSLRHPVVQYQRKPAVAFKERHHELQKLFRPLEAYEWHDDQNKIAAFHAVESSAYATVNGFKSQVALYRRNAVSFYDKDRAEKTVAIGKKHGHAMKQFAIHKVKSVERQCVIKSNKFDWIVQHIDISQEPVPKRFLKQNADLIRKGIRFDSHAIAVPYKPNYMPAGHALKQKATQTIKEFKDYANVVSKVAAKGIKAAAPALAAAGAVTSTVLLTSRALAAFMTDPVFIGIYGNDIMFMVEIGRWD